MKYGFKRITLVAVKDGKSQEHKQGGILLLRKDYRRARRHRQVKQL
jgi:hypothetical protein